MLSQEKMKYVYIIGNIFINTQSILKILLQSVMFLMFNIFRKTLLQLLGYERQQRSEQHSTVI